jgi:queuine/archaeosine tRNA-ribosyltransferase
MKFFVAWSRRDPVFQEFDKECHVLVSHTNLTKNWSVSNWRTLPRVLFVDSAAFSNRSNQIPSCKEVFNRQLYIAKSWPEDRKLFFSHPDILIPLNSHFDEKCKIINLSLERAKKYFEFIAKSKCNANPIGVIHGFDEEDILNTYYELLDTGYRYFALGSIGSRISKNRELCINAIKIVQKYDIQPMHIFGITPIKNEEVLNNIASFDSAAPSKLGFFGTVLYGSPLKRYVIAPDAKQKYHDKCFTFRTSIPVPLPCECPICRVDPHKLTLKYNSNANQNRAIHNYFQIKWEIEKISSHGRGL